MLDKALIESWIKKGPDNTTLEAINQFSRDIAGDVTRAQIRQIFSKMKNIEAKGINEEKLVAQKSEFLMLKPLLAYAAGRHKKTGLTNLKDALTQAIDQVSAAGNEDKEWKLRFKNFCKLFEAILAYHRAHGGN